VRIGDESDGRPDDPRSMIVDIAANRRTHSWRREELAGRLAWSLAYGLFRFSPRICWAWRVWLLRRFGAEIGREVHIYPSVRIAVPWNLAVGDFAAIGDRVNVYNLGKISIGSRATVSQGAHLCGGTHDYRQASLPLVKCPIHVGEGAWICADAFIGPNVIVGDYAIIGARAVAMRDVAAWTIVAGNPAQRIGERTRPTAS
jgi:putative colanic acid biosynthesis acetyltransferase WcaF